MQKNATKRLKSYIAPGIIVLGSVIVAYFCYLIFLYCNPQQQISYKLFAPTKLPNSTSVSYTMIEVWSGAINIGNAQIGLDLWPSQTNVQLMLTNSAGRIRESKFSEADAKKAACLDAQTPNMNCVQKTTPNNQSYILKTHKDDKTQRPVMQNIYFAKDGTIITMYATQEKDAALAGMTDAQWEEVIDSFVPFTITNKSVEHHYTKP